MPRREMPRGDRPHDRVVGVPGRAQPRTLSGFDLGDVATCMRGLRARLAIVLALGAAGCAPAHDAAYEAALGSAARNEGAGRFAAAAADYDRAARVGRRDRDQDQARWDAAEATARAGNVADAAARFEALAGDGGSEYQAEAALRLALLRIDSGDADRGWSDMEVVARTFPTHGVAHVAVRK